MKTMRFHHTSIKMAGEDAKQLELQYAKILHSFWEKAWKFLRKWSIHNKHIYDWTILLLGIYARETNKPKQQKKCPHQYLTWKVQLVQLLSYI